MTNEPETLGDIDHTNPYTGRVFGETQAYGRGRTVAADGGESGGADSDGADDETLGDVSHIVGRTDTDATQRSFDRGGGDGE